MIKFINSHITASKYIYKLIKHSQDNPPKVRFTDEYYTGPNGENVQLKIFHPKKQKKLSIIMNTNISLHLPTNLFRIMTFQLPN